MRTKWSISCNDRQLKIKDKILATLLENIKYKIEANEIPNEGPIDKIENIAESV
jgi:hypothetical protein